MRKLLVTLVFLLLLVSAVSAAVESCKPIFKTTESITLKSSAIPCNNLPSGEEVVIYIIDDLNSSSPDVLNSIEKNNSVFGCISVWNSPNAGNFDFFVDCIANGEYDLLEPFGSFQVQAVAGTASASLGNQSLPSTTWRYDAENPILISELIQLSLKARGENIQLDRMTISTSGTGSYSEIEAVEVYSDDNNNGAVDNGESLIGTAENDLILLDTTLEKDSIKNIIIAYKFKETAFTGTYSVSATSILGVGAVSGQNILFSGLPLSSPIKTILPAKTCTGQIELSLTPNPVEPDSDVLASISGLSGCQGKAIFITQNSCNSAIEDKECSCVLTLMQEGDSCTCTFNSDSESRTYTACIDKNDNLLMDDAGESSAIDLIIETKNSETDIPIVNESEEEIPGEDTNSITGGIIEEVQSKFSTTSGLFILLEITLILIFFVLVMIFFRLRHDRQEKN